MPLCVSCNLAHPLRCPAACTALPAGDRGYEKPLKAREGRENHFQHNRLKQADSLRLHLQQQQHCLLHLFSYRIRARTGLQEEAEEVEEVEEG